MKSAWMKVASGIRSDGPTKLLRREVDAGEAAALGEEAGRPDAGADAELEDGGMRREQVEQLLDALDACRALDLPLPGGEAIGHRVVAVLDQLLHVLAHPRTL